MGTQRIGHDDRLQDQIFYLKRLLVVEAQQQVTNGDCSRKLIDLLPAGKNFAVFGFQEILNDLIPAFIDVHPLQVGAVCHQMYRPLIGEIKDLLMDDVLLRINYTLTGGGLQHRPQLHLGNNLTPRPDADQPVDHACRVREQLYERIEDDANQVNGRGSGNGQLFRIVQCHGLGYQLTHYDGEISDQKDHQHHGYGISKRSGDWKLLKERHQIFGKARPP